MSRRSNDNRLSTNRSVILHFWKQGDLSTAEIARLSKIPVRTVRYNIAKIEKYGTMNHRGGSGRTRKIKHEDSIAIGQWIRRNKEITAEEITDKLKSNRNLTVSKWTVRRQLHRMGYKSVLPLATPMLTPEHKERRVRWVKAHINDDWNRTVFSDESCFQLFRNTVRRWSKFPQQEWKRIPKNRQKVMVWGAFSIKGQISCHSFRRTMDGPYYVQILENNLLDEARAQFGRRWRFQLDNDPKHTSNIARQFLDQQVPETIDWPSNSPDVNPTENLWSIIERNVEKRKPSNIDELEEFIHEEWENIDLSTLMNLVFSMKSRCLALIESKGERIKY